MSDEEKIREKLIRWRTRGGLGIDDHLIDEEPAASALNKFAGRTLLNKLEPVAKCVALLDVSLDLDWPERKLKFESNDFVERNLHFEDGAKARLADVDGMAVEAACAVRDDYQVGINLETRMPASLRRDARRAHLVFTESHGSSGWYVLGRTKIDLSGRPPAYLT